MSYTVKNGQTSVVLRLKLLDSSSTTGAGLTGLTSASSGLIISTIADNEASATPYTVAGSTIETITTLGTYATPTATKCRFKEVDSTNHKGIYEIQIADARFAVSSAKSLLISIVGATNLAQCDYLVPLVVDDPYVAKLTSASLPTNFSSFSIDGSGRVDVAKIAGAAQTARDLGASVLISSGTGTGQLSVTSGVIDANATKWAGTATTLTGSLPDVNVKTIKDGIIAAATFAANALDAVWSTATRLLTAGTNIVLAKGTGVTGFNDLDAAGVRTAVGLASANLDTQLGTIAGYIDTEIGTLQTTASAIKAKTDNLPASPAATGDAMTLTSAYNAAKTAAQDGDAMTLTGAYDAAKTAASQTSVDDIPTNAELATALAGADDATLAAIAALPTAVTVAAIKAKTDNLPSDPADASDIASAFGTVATAFAALPTAATVNAIKARTDLIPGTIDGKTFAEHITLQSAVLFGKASGLATTTVHFRSLDDSKDRVVASVDESGNRSAVTLDAG